MCIYICIHTNALSNCDIILCGTSLFANNIHIWLTLLTCERRRRRACVNEKDRAKEQARKRERKRQRKEACVFECALVSYLNKCV